MRSFARFAIAVALFAPGWQGIQAQDALRPEVLRQIKDATAFVKVKSRQFSSTGSGFLLRKDGRTGYLVTNSHVVHRDEDPNPLVEVVLNSGEAKERVLTAEVIGDEEARDLAVLRVTADDLPVPIKADELIEPFETMQVLIIGFPFGTSLAARGRNPAITITSSSVSSLRRNAFGQIAMIQVDGGIHPGNSGGPVLTRAGTLLGISVSKVGGTEIGFAIPAQELREMLQGRVRQIVFRRFEGLGQQVKLEVKGSVIDPLRTLERVSLHYAPARDVGKYAIDKDGKWPPISPDAKQCELMLKEGAISGNLDLGTIEKNKSRYIFQPSYVRGDGQQVFSAPVTAWLFEISYAFPEALSSRKSSRPSPTPQPEEDDLTTLPPAALNLSGLSPEEAFFRHDRGTVFTINHSAVVEERSLSKDPPLVSKRLRIRGEKPIPFAVFMPQGDRLFLATEGGSIRSYAIPSLIEERRLELAAPCSYIGLTREGLVAHLNQFGILAVIDPETLTIKRFLKANGWKHIACSPDSPLVYVQPGLYEHLWVADLEQAKIIRRLTVAEVQRQQGQGETRFFGWDRLAVSPNGKFLIAAKGMNGLYRWTLNEDSVAYEQSTFSMHLQEWSITADNKHVLAFASSFNDSGLSAVERGVYFFPIENLRRPSMVIEARSAVGMVLDEARRVLYCLDDVGVLRVHPLDIGKAERHVLTDENDRGKGLFGHPSGAGMVAIQSDTALWIDVSGK